MTCRRSGRAPGNHGQVIPRDRELLHQLYWDECLSLPRIAARYGVTHKSVERVMRQLGIPRRPRRTKGIGRQRCDCGRPTFKKRHAGNGALYGTKCEECNRQYRNAMARDYIRRPGVHEKRQRELRRWYYDGPLTPNGESQWISRGRSLLRSAQRLLAGRVSPHRSESQSAELRRASISPT